MRWFTIEATKSMFSDGMEFDCRCLVRVRARDKNDAMRRVRTEFRHFHLRVL